MVGKSGCVLHARDHDDRSWGCLGKSTAKTRSEDPPNVGILGNILVELDRFHWAEMLAEGVPIDFGCRELA